MSDNLLFIHRTDLQTDDVETIWIEMRPLHSKPYLICNVYRPPDSTNQWFSSFEKQISTAVETNNELIVLVDFNMNILNNNSKDKLWKMFIENYNFKLEKVFKKKHSCGFIFSKLCYTPIFLIPIFSIKLNLSSMNIFSINIYTCPVNIHCYFNCTD